MASQLSDGHPSGLPRSAQWEGVPHRIRLFCSCGKRLAVGQIFHDHNWNPSVSWDSGEHVQRGQGGQAKDEFICGVRCGRRYVVTIEGQLRAALEALGSPPNDPKLRADFSGKKWAYPQVVVRAIEARLVLGVDLPRPRVA